MVRPSHDLGQRGEPLALRPIDQILTVEVQAIKEERRHGDRPLQFGNVEPAPEPAHRHLKGLGLAVGSKGDRFAVEDGRPSRQPPDRLDDLRDSVGRVGKVSGEHSHLVIGAMDLDPGAVKLPFDRGRADPGEGGGD